MTSMPRRHTRSGLREVKTTLTPIIVSLMLIAEISPSLSSVEEGYLENYPLS
jgi:hypothetical protein